jgi:hypothetical protein
MNEKGVGIRTKQTEDSLRLGRSTPLFAPSAMLLLTPECDQWQLDARGIRHTDPFGTVEE